MPSGTYEYIYNGDPTDLFYTIYETDLSDQEKAEYFLLKQNATITTIKNCVVFFTVITVISLIIIFITGFIIGSGF